MVGPRFQGWGPAAEVSVPKKPNFPKPPILETAVFICASLRHLAHLRTCARGAERQRDARGWQPPSPPTAGAQRCTEGPPHARTRSTRLWRCVGRVGGEAGLRNETETAGQRSEGPSCRRPAPAPTEFPCPLPSSPYRRGCRRPKPNAPRKRRKGVGGWAKPPPTGHVL